MLETIKWSADMVRLGLIILAFFGLAVGPIAANNVSPTEVTGAITVDVAKAKALFERGVLFVDVRTDADWDAGRIPGAQHIELKKNFTEEALGKLVGKDKEVVIYCNGENCLRSAEACTKAVTWGFAKIYYFRDGYPGWKTAGYPVE